MMPNRRSCRSTLREWSPGSARRSPAAPPAPGLAACSPVPPGPAWRGQEDGREHRPGATRHDPMVAPGTGIGRVVQRVTNSRCPGRARHERIITVIIIPSSATRLDGWLEIERKPGEHRGTGDEPSRAGCGVGAWSARPPTRLQSRAEAPTCVQSLAFILASRVPAPCAAPARTGLIALAGDGLRWTWTGSCD